MKIIKFCILLIHNFLFQKLKNVCLFKNITSKEASILIFLPNLKSSPIWICKIGITETRCGAHITLGGPFPGPNKDMLFNNAQKRSRYNSSSSGICIFVFLIKCFAESYFRIALCIGCNIHHFSSPANGVTAAICIAPGGKDDKIFWGAVHSLGLSTIWKYSYIKLTRFTNIVLKYFIYSNLHIFIKIQVKSFASKCQDEIIVIHFYNCIYT